MSNQPFGRLLGGDPATMAAAWSEFNALPVDLDLLTGDESVVADRPQSTIAEPATVSGKGTFAAKNTTSIRFEPYAGEGWWFARSDIEEELPVAVSIRNVWTTGTTVSNIVLRSGGPSNYIRLVEHIICLKMGLGIDSLMVRIDSGDPPIFDQGSRDILHAFDQAGRRQLDRPATFVTVRERVALAGSHGGFIVLEPPIPGRRALTVDCGLAFPNAIGRQRIRFPATEKWVRHGCVARTNTPYSKVVYCKTIGKLFADIRNLGYSRENVLIAGRTEYKNEPRLVHQGKSLEAAWHRAILDLLAAVALIEGGNFVGHITSFKAGHRLDVAMIKQVYLQDVLVPA